MSRKCCCCIPVVVGAAILGLIALLFCASELTVLIPYLAQFDIETFNPIQQNLNDIYFVFDDLLKNCVSNAGACVFNMTTEYKNDILEQTKSYESTVLMGAAVESGVYGLTALLMVIGIAAKSRFLMLPYMILTLLGIIVLVLAGVGACVYLFFDPELLVAGVIASVTTLIFGSIMMYLWSVVQRAFVDLGNDDRMYSPVGTKDNGIDYNGGRNAYHYPTSPQQFQMDERK